MRFSACERMSVCVCVIKLYSEAHNEEPTRSRAPPLGGRNGDMLGCKRRGHDACNKTGDNEGKGGRGLAVGKPAGERKPFTHRCLSTAEAQPSTHLTQLRDGALELAAA
jgi:hypothetical protein